MGMEIKLTLNHDLGLELDTRLRRGLVKGGEAILGVSNERAPREEHPKHGVHMTDTGFVRLETGSTAGDRVAIGYEAWWAIFTHEGTPEHGAETYPSGGENKFLERSLIEGGESALEVVAAALRGEL
ncbi:MAG TPA: hypothetical protein VJ851_00650 [Jatrophihabitans sp.]|nr:hypothetical protein [Jatrophihabitans sp.]